MLKELNEFNTEKLKEYLNSGSIDSEYLMDVIESTLSRPELINIRDKSFRRKRNGFMEEIEELTSKVDLHIKELINRKNEFIAASELLFDRLSVFLDQCAISKIQKEKQVWAHIKRVEYESNHLDDAIDKILNKKPEKQFILSPYVTIKNEIGNEYSADGAIENLIEYLSITLKLLAYKFKWFNGETLIIPTEVTVSEDEIYQAGSIGLLARSWKELEDSSQRGLLFGGDVYSRMGDEVQQDAKEAGVKITYHFERNESVHELYDSIACERLKKKSLQNFMEIISVPEMRSKVEADIVSVGRLEDGSFLHEDEILACSILGDVFCTNIFKDEKCYHGLRLSEWIRGYFSIQYIAKNIKAGKAKSILGRDDICDTLIRSGIPKDKCYLFIDLVTFSRNSKDLYDSPLIKLEDNRFYISYSSCLNTNVSNIILSRFSSLDTDTSGKGYAFEDEVRTVVSNNVGNCEHIKFKRGLEEYEYDAVFILDSRLFVLECKNRSLSWYNPVKTFRNKNSLFEYAEQLIRLKDALINYPEVIHEYFGVNILDYEIIPVLINGTPFSWADKIAGVYVTDFSAFSRLLKSSEINMVASSLKGQENKGSKYRQWKGNKLCSDDILKHLKNPIQLICYQKSRKFEYSWWPADEEVSFTVKNYDVDPSEFQRQEKKLFYIPPVKNKSKKKSKSNLKSMVKHSRKKNRCK